MIFILAECHTLRSNVEPLICSMRLSGRYTLNNSSYSMSLTLLTPSNIKLLKRYALSCLRRIYFLPRSRQRR